MNSKLVNLLIRRASVYNLHTQPYHRPNLTTYIFAPRHSQNLPARNLSTSKKLPLKKLVCKSSSVHSYCQIGCRSLSSNLPPVDLEFDVRKLHHIFQFGLAVQQILPSK